MAGRSISVTVVANVAGYMTSMQSAAAVTKEFGSTAAASSVKHEKALGNIGTKAFIAGGLVTAAFVAAAKASADFDSKMSLVKANIDDKTAPSMKRLSDAALSAGKTTAFSATQAADAEGELAKAGLTSAQITGGALTASLNLASAGQIGLGDAAEYVSSTMVQFGLKAKDAAHIADVLAAGADKSLGGVTDLAEGLKYAGVPAAQFGISLDQTVGVLAEFASNGIEGSMAGTALRQMLLSLAAPTTEAAGVMQEYGIQVFNAQGKFIGLNGVAGQLHDKLGGLSKQEQQAALNALFTARSISTANILMRDGAKGVDKWTAAVNDQGFASQQASTKLDNLSGDAKKLGNTLQADLIEAGHDVTPFLRNLAQGATAAAREFGELPGPVRQGAEALVGVLGGVSLLGGGIAVALPKLQKFKAALSELAPEGTLAGSALSAMPGIIGGITAALAAAAIIYNTFASDSKNAKNETEGFTQAFQADSDAVGKNSRQYAANLLQKNGAIELAKKAGISTSQLTDAVLGETDAQKLYNKYRKEGNTDGWAAANVAIALNKEFVKGRDAAHNVAEATKEDTDAKGKNKTAAQQAAEAQKKLNDEAAAFAKAHASDPAYLLAGALANIGPNAKDDADQIKNLTTALDAFNDLAHGVADSSAAAGDALHNMAKDGAKGASVQQILSDNLLHANGQTRKLQENLSAVSGGYTKNLTSVFKDTAATKGNNAALVALNRTHADQVATLKHVLAQMGITGKEADQLAAKYAGIPKDLSSKVQLARVAEAEADAKSVKESVDRIPKQHTTVTQAQISALQQKLDDAKRSIAGVPSQKTTTLYAHIADAQYKLNLVASTLANLHDKSVTITTYLQTQARTFGGRNNVKQQRAGGGQVRAGEPYIVGEFRRELFVPETNGHILPKVPEPVAVPVAARPVAAVSAVGGPAGVDRLAQKLDALTAAVRSQEQQITVISKLNGREISRDTTRRQKQDIYGRGING